MMNESAETLRRAIENLINVKLHDALRPDGIARLVAHRASGVASFDIRNAQRQLEQSLNEKLALAERQTKPQAPTSRRMN